MDASALSRLLSNSLFLLVSAIPSPISVLLKVFDMMGPLRICVGHSVSSSLSFSESSKVIGSRQFGDGCEGFASCE